LNQDNLKKDEQGKITETPQQLFQRVAANIASAESFFNPSISDDELFWYLVKKFL